MSRNTMDAILERRSIRGYTPEPITDEQVAILEKAAMAAPSAVNYQPWHFTFVRDRALLNEISRISVAKLKRASSFHIFFEAPLVVFISADRTNKWGELDSGIAVQNLALAAQAMGLGSVIVGMADAAFKTAEGTALTRKLEFPDTHDFAISIAIGHPAMNKLPHDNHPGRITRIDENS